MLLAAAAGTLRLVARQQVFPHLQLPARELGPGTDVEVFPVHEEALVEAADLAVGVASKQHEQARNPGRHRRALIAWPPAGHDFERRDDLAMLLGRALARLQDARR